MSTSLSPEHIELLDMPLYASLGTVRPDNTVQVNPMWYERDGDTIRFTHTNKRAKYRSLQKNPSMSLMVVPPDNPLTYLELRGHLSEVIADPKGEFYVRLSQRYGKGEQPPADSPDRVILVMTIDKVLAH